VVAGTFFLEELCLCDDRFSAITIFAFDCFPGKHWWEHDNYSSN